MRDLRQLTQLLSTFRLCDPLSSCDGGSRPSGALRCGDGLDGERCGEIERRNGCGLVRCRSIRWLRSWGTPCSENRVPYEAEVTSSHRKVNLSNGCYRDTRKTASNCASYVRSTPVDL